MTRTLISLALALTLGAQAAGACAVAEGCPMGPPDPCARMRLAEGYTCLPDPSAPEGFWIEARLPIHPEAPDCAMQQAEACVRPAPGPGESPLWRALAAWARL